ncbi:hypothetical protein [Legionella bononiensis]|uniref:Substrate of the Dot/Icm secretion system n=1 Tax=Legionella bononiensis TaxID=2793102 RepID=A0ABS1WD05_9GAMM|nr:hypothetical protein [Legionella bononiensis]MBL7479108.1 hypothetical protein [Legionella bononiensis]MBL7527241.1 hypothetical protein [Legionella bononiensis]MBL7562210.1 hypothetical protein [Legionella bononiensis]
MPYNLRELAQEQVAFSVQNPLIPGAMSIMKQGNPSGEEILNRMHNMPGSYPYVAVNMPPIQPVMVHAPTPAGKQVMYHVYKSTVDYITDYVRTVSDLLRSVTETKSESDINANEEVALKSVANTLTPTDINAAVKATSKIVAEQVIKGKAALTSNVGGYAFKGLLGDTINQGNSLLVDAFIDGINKGIVESIAKLQSGSLDFKQILSKSSFSIYGLLSGKAASAIAKSIEQSPNGQRLLEENPMVMKGTVALATCLLTVAIIRSPQEGLRSLLQNQQFINSNVGRLMNSSPKLMKFIHNSADKDIKLDSFVTGVYVALATSFAFKGTKPSAEEFQQLATQVEMPVEEFKEVYFSGMELVEKLEDPDLLSLEQFSEELQQFTVMQSNVSLTQCMRNVMNQMKLDDAKAIKEQEQEMEQDESRSFSYGS